VCVEQRQQAPPQQACRRREHTRNPPSRATSRMPLPTFPLAPPHLCAGLLVRQVYTCLHGMGRAGNGERLLGARRGLPNCPSTHIKYTAVNLPTVPPIACPPARSAGMRLTVVLDCAGERREPGHSMWVAQWDGSWVLQACRALRGMLW